VTIGQMSKQFVNKKAIARVVLAPSSEYVQDVPSLDISVKSCTRTLSMDSP